MGLAISVGNPCVGYDEEGEEQYQRDFQALSRILADNGVTWSEPDTMPPPDAMRPHVTSFPYSYLHYLRRAYALLFNGEPVTPAASYDEMASDDAKVEDAASHMTSHLLCHDDGEGFYVPVEFADPVFIGADDGDFGFVGSSQALLRELIAVAPTIGVTLQADGSLDDETAARLVENDGDPYAIEQTVWLALYEACRASIAHGNAIVFH
jgi:hypothetical protein